MELDAEQSWCFPSKMQMPLSHKASFRFTTSLDVKNLLLLQFFFFGSFFFCEIVDNVNTD